MHRIMDIRLEHLNIGYKRGKAVATDISATFRGGELTCLIGRNGTGKSTMLKTIAGFLKPFPPLKSNNPSSMTPNSSSRNLHSSSIFFGGNDSTTMTQLERAKMVSVVLTTVPRVRNLTVREMTSLGRSPYTGFFGTLGDDDERIINEAIADVGITPLAVRMIQTLSDGERQKVMIARALAQQTPAILLDEPTAFLDYPSKVELMQLLRRLAHKHNKTIIMTTHDLDLCFRFADKIFLLSDGSLRTVRQEEASKFFKRNQ